MTNTVSTAHELNAQVSNSAPVTATGVDLSKILGGQTKILGGRRW